MIRKLPQSTLKTWSADVWNSDPAWLINAPLITTNDGLDGYKRMAKGTFKFLSPAPHTPILPDDQVKRLYPRYRWQIMESTFLGYACSTWVRNNLSPCRQGDRGGAALRPFDDRQHPGGHRDLLRGRQVHHGVDFRPKRSRKFMALGLLLTAICNFMFGGVANYYLHMALWSMNGFFQGMGWPPCGRSMGHWFSARERGVFFSTWNTSHNLGGGIAGILAAYARGHFGWQAAFYFPVLSHWLGALYLFWRLRDTPQSVGLRQSKSTKTITPKMNSSTACTKKNSAPKSCFSMSC